MGIDRREFLKIVGLTAILGLLDKAGFELLVPGELEAQYLPKPEALKAKRWAMVIDLRNVDEEIARRCIEVCHRIHNVPDFENPRDPKDKVDPKEKVRWEIKWIWTEPFENAFPSQKQEHLAERFKGKPVIVLCNHCDNPACVRVCPTKATWRREDGIVMMDMHRCIGCRFCMAACPFGSRSFNWGDPRPYIRPEKRNPEYPTREKGVVEKCDFCAERLAKGLMPACVEVSNGALIFGDIKDPNSEVRKALRTHYTIRRKPYLGTNPQVYYIIM